MIEHLEALAPWIQLGSFGVLSFGVVWFLTKGMPMLLDHMASMTNVFLAAQKESRDYHRQDVEAMRGFMSGQLDRNRDSIAGLARAIERNTIAQVASQETVEDALAKYTNGGTGAKPRHE